jgi:exodeoxyribonuclease VII small subunit
MAETPTFEERFLRLQETITSLEQGGLPLDEAIARFEQGIKMAAECRAMLDAAELRVTRLMESDQFADLPEPDEDEE